MDENEPDIHPLDRDYSDPVERPRELLSYDPQLRRAGVYVFAAGLILMFLAAIFLSNFVGVRVVETVGSIVHRLGMLTGLIGGLLVVAAYRLEHLKQMMGWVAGSGQRSKPILGLFVLNILAFLFVVFLSYLIGRSSGWAYVITMTGLVPITFAFMLTVAIWHDGYIRAYAVGFLVGIFVNFVSSLFTFQGRFWDWRSLILTSTAISMISGLVCSAYVYWLESARNKHAG